MDKTLVKKLLVDNRTGIINKVEKLFFLPGSIPLKAYRAQGNFVIREEDNFKTIKRNTYNGLGFSVFSDEKAEISALGEFVERYCSTFVTQEILEKCISEEFGNKLDLTQVTTVSEELAKKYNIKKLTIDQDTSFYWVQGMDLHTNESIWIPTDLVYLTTYIKNESPIRDMVSTGTATGNSINDAIIRGLLECIERDAITIMWLNKLSMPIVDNNTINDKEISEVIKRIEDQGLKVTILDISNNINIPSFFTVIESNTSPYISTGASTKFNRTEALMSSIEEAIAIYNLSLLKITNNTIDNFDPTDIKNLNDMDKHSDYYAINDMRSKISFLFAGKKIKWQEDDSNYIHNYEQLITELKKLNIDVYAVDLTTKDIEKTNLYVVKTIVPKFAFLECSIPMDQCNRLKEVPSELGYDVNDELNDLIHPFP
ncbi:YcaO-like family protein [Heyndrickxia sp. FSL K6-6286]|uniref:YcaO-like family protein n=1 Tax=Heyndrickxia sp. FSL K6-6286 TaxID=2921510 RepID=UPI003159DC19